MFIYSDVPSSQMSLTGSVPGVLIQRVVDTNRTVGHLGCVVIHCFLPGWHSAVPLSPVDIDELFPQRIKN